MLDTDTAPNQTQDGIISNEKSSSVHPSERDELFYKATRKLAKLRLIGMNGLGSKSAAGYELHHLIAKSFTCASSSKALSFSAMIWTLGSFHISE